MAGLREEVNRLDSLHHQAALSGQEGQIPSQGRWVAADVGHCCWWRGRQGSAYGSGQALARRVDQQTIAVGKPLHQAGRHIGLLKGGPAQAIGSGISPGLLHRAEVTFQSQNCGTGCGQGQAEGADAAIGIHQPLALQGPKSL